MNERERIIRLWFDMWLKQQDLGIDDIFTEDVVYTESWSPKYQDRKTVKHWFNEWNTRGKVLIWDIKLILVLPCTTQTKGWSKDDIAVYEEIKSQADKVVYTSHDYFRGCMFKRNRHLVNGSSVCIAYLTQEKGGTAYTVNYARQSNVQVINLAAQ